MSCPRHEPERKDAPIRVSSELPRAIVVMTYRREKRFQKLIRQLRDLLPDAAEAHTHMIVAQSVDSSVEKFTAAHESSCWHSLGRRRVMWCSS